jgi:hypothetical protein
MVVYFHAVISAYCRKLALNDECYYAVYHYVEFHHAECSSALSHGTFIKQSVSLLFKTSC